MTDNRTTELLRKLLEERGVKWRETINHANCIFTWWESPTFGIVHAMDNEDGETLFMACLNSCDFTPEQAIAATLGSDNEYERKMDTLLCRLTNGKWSKSRAYDLDFMESCVNEEFEALYSEEQFSAPVHGTLTAEQVRETVEKHGVNDGCVYSIFKGSFKAIADELNAELGSGTCELLYGEDDDDDGHLVEPKHCQECGAKVVGL